MPTTEPDRSSRRPPQKFGDRTPWRPVSAGAAVIAILSGAAAVATAVSLLLRWTAVIESSPPATAVAPALLGLVWLVVFQTAVVVQTVLVARAHGGTATRLLSLTWTGREPRAVAAAVFALGTFAAIYAAIVFAVDRPAIVQDLATAATLARSEVWLLALVAIGIGAPFSEEVLFRGFLFPALSKSRLGLAGAAVVSTAGWTALHAGYSVYGLVEVCLVGLFFCWLTVRTGSLWVPILCHAIYNTAIVLGLRWLPIPL